MEKDSNQVLRSLFINNFREALKNRYDIINVYQYENLKGLSSEKIYALQNFFLDHIYPPFEKRNVRDEALNALVEILKNPTKLWSLLRSLGFRNFVNLGKDFFKTIQVGLNLISTYLDSLKLEDVILEEVVNQKIQANDFNQSKLFKLISSIDKKYMHDFQKKIFSLFSSLSDSKILSKAIYIMKESRVVFQNELLFNENERKGLEYAINLLDEGLKLFLSLSQHEIKLILDGIKKIEIDWYNTCLEISVNN